MLQLSHSAICDYASSIASDLVKHLKTHSGEKSKKCNQCDFASSYAHHLRRRLKMHSGESFEKMHRCDNASSEAGTLRTHMKIYSREKSNKCKDRLFEESFSHNLKVPLGHMEQDHLKMNVAPWMR